MDSATLHQILSHCPVAKLEQYAPLLSAAMAEAHIDTPLREAAFIAQVAHESYEFRFMEEVWGPTPAQLRYEPPSSLATRLGNTEPGDGLRFKGRGPIQLTGRANYRTCGKDLVLDLENHPELGSQPEVGFRIACWYWTKHGLNVLADNRDFVGITKAINGGTNGLEQREAYYSVALRVLGGL